MLENLLVGIDVGGTKVAGALVRENGQILSRAKYPTPQNAGIEDIASVIEKILKELTHRRNIKIKELTAIGIAVPGIVDSHKGKILVTPNVGLSGWSIAKDLEKKLKAKVFAGNDVNLGLLAEKWLGAARDSQNVVGVFPGTGVGGAAIINGELITGFQGAAGEFGHMALLPDGPKCGCGNRGCLEVLASRKAIEREIRNLIKDGRKSLIKKYTDGDLGQIKSKVLAKALAKKDKVTIECVGKAAGYLGLGCVSLRHIFDPEMIVLGGGLIEACGDFIIPIVQKVLDKDPFFAPLGNCRIARSALGDDAVTLGAAALALQQSGKKLLKKKAYPLVECLKFGEVLVNDKVFTKDIYIRADGKVKKRIKKFSPKNINIAARVGEQEVRKICKKKPEILIVGAGQRSQLEIASDARKYLKDRGIELKVLPAPQAASVYNENENRKALLMHLAG